MNKQKWFDCMLSVLAVSAFANCVVARHVKADILSERMIFWESMAPLCRAAGFTFPSSETEESKPCGDGDMTLFNGMLCAAGDERGCQAVADAQGASGEWHRSPRLRVLGHNDRGDATFSPDMALGVQLFLITKRDRERGWKWLTWLHENVPCTMKSWFSNACWVEGMPRFCAPHQGCTARPGDLATLAWTVDFLQTRAGMPPLPDGRLRGMLGTFAGIGSFNKELDANLNKPGFSQHLVGVSVWIVRLAGYDDQRMRSAIDKLVERNPNNAFFLYLRDGKSNEAKEKMLARCPSPERPSQQPLYEWQWERDEQSGAWKHSNYWDCIFLGKLLTD
jgi:hypothetical protein